MGGVKPREPKGESEKESSIARALKGLRNGLYPSIRKWNCVHHLTEKFSWRTSQSSRTSGPATSNSSRGACDGYTT